MTAPNWDLSHEIEAAGKRLVALSKQVEENDNFIAKLMKGDDVAARIAAEARVAELEAELAKANAARDELSQRTIGQTRQLQGIRRALNGSGRNPLVDHAYEVFRALIDSAPNHPLVERVPGDEPEQAALSRSDLRAIYACLKIAHDVLARQGCNDWDVKDPDEATLRFMQRVEDYVAQDDSGHERVEVKTNAKGIAYGPVNFMVPSYLRKIMEQVYGKATFEDVGNMGLR